VAVPSDVIEIRGDPVTEMVVVDVLETLVDDDRVLDDIGDFDKRGDNEYVFDCLGE
jgi:hypothetical protein